MNEELTLDGVKYISAKRAADLTQYSKDYVGQLCREGKILASRIGRNWYIAEKSILRYKTENGTETPFISHIRKTEDVRLLVSSSKGDEEKPQSSSRSRASVYGGPLATYHSDDRSLLPQLKKGKTESPKESQQNDNGHAVRIRVVASHADMPIKHVGNKPARASVIYLEKAIVASMFIAVSLGLFILNSDSDEALWIGVRELSSASALDAFDQTAEFISKTVDDTVYNYLYASLFND